MSEENKNNYRDFYYEPEDVFLDSYPFETISKPVSNTSDDIIDLLVEVSEYFVDHKIDNELSQKTNYLIEKLQKNM